ncbi:MAG: 4-(cytidine 5'-diphospho)-2-C-methyl-D-erythritol kinase [Rhodospirillaceae bacterium]
MADAPVTVRAPAKLNLYLHVTGRRDDGYHLLDTLIAFADVGDVVTVRAAPGRTLALNTRGRFAKDLADEPDNLVLRAARALRVAARIDAGAHIVLEKNLPVASGIGGGSADAAAALKALTRLWGVALPEKAVLDIALGLGADVPICWHGAPAFVGGIGEAIDPAPTLPPVGLVLVNPLVPVSTPAVFKAWQGGFQGKGRFAQTPTDAAHLCHLLGGRENGLTDAAQGVAPEVGHVLGAIAAEDGVLLTRMSGSGGTCFGLFGDDDGALDAAGRLADAHPDWWVAAGRLARPRYGLS